MSLNVKAYSRLYLRPVSELPPSPCLPEELQERIRLAKEILKVNEKIIHVELLNLSFRVMQSVC